MVNKKALRGIAFEREGRVVAVCLDHYLVSSCSTWEELRETIERMMGTHVEASLELGQKPFESLPPAPARYWDMYNETERNEAIAPRAADREARTWDLLPQIVRLDHHLAPA